MKKYIPAPKNIILTAILALMGTFVNPIASAHNQSPATIRRSIDKAFKTLEAPMPSNVFKGQKTVKVAGGTAQVFEARKDGKIVGQVAQIEFQEETYAIAVNSATKQVSGVVRAGSTLEESEWKALPFVESVRQALAGTEAK